MIPGKVWSGTASAAAGALDSRSTLLGQTDHEYFSEAWMVGDIDGETRAQQLVTDPDLGRNVWFIAGWTKAVPCPSREP